MSWRFNAATNELDYFADLQEAYNASPDGNIILDGTKDIRIQNNALADRLVVTEDYVSMPGSGTNSQKFGIDSVASGLGSTAVGDLATASDVLATAVGGFSVAPGSSSTAIGGFAIVSGDSSTAVGAASDAAESSTAIGSQASASGSNSFAMGRNSSAKAGSCFALGTFSLIDAAHSGSIALGFGANTSAANQFMITGVKEMVLGGGDVEILPGADVLFRVTNLTPIFTPNISGRAITIETGDSIGDAPGGVFSVKVSPTGVSGLGSNAQVTRFVIPGDGPVELYDKDGVALLDALEVNGNTIFKGGIIKPVKEIAFADSPYQLLVTDYNIDVDTSGGDVEILLIPCVAGQEFSVMKITSDGNKITLTPDGTDTIDVGETDLEISLFKDAPKISGNAAADDWRVR